MAGWEQPLAGQLEAAALGLTYAFSCRSEDMLELVAEVRIGDRGPMPLPVPSLLPRLRAWRMGKTGMRGRRLGGVQGCGSVVAALCTGAPEPLGNRSLAHSAGLAWGWNLPFYV